MSNWTLFSNHGHVLFCLARNPDARLRDVASDVGITERAVQKIVRDLQDGSMVSVKKNGRRNSYRIDTSQALRHDLESACTLRDLIKIVNKKTTVNKKTASKGSSFTEAEVVSQAVSDSNEASQTPEISAEPAPASADIKERQQGSLF